MELSPVILAGCGLAVLCAGLILVAVMLVLRFVGGGGRGGAILGLFGGAARNEEGLDADLLPQRRSRSLSSSDLQNKAQSLDFDAALQKYRQTPPGDAGYSASNAPAQRPPGLSGAPDLRGGPPPAPLNNPPRANDDDPLDDFDARGFNLRNSNNQSLRRSRRTHEDDRDDFVGGFLDGD